MSPPVFPAIPHVHGNGTCVVTCSEDHPAPEKHAWSVIPHELWPVMTLESPPGIGIGNIELTSEELADFLQTWDRWLAWQRRLVKSSDYAVRTTWHDMQPAAGHEEPAHDKSA